MQTEAALRESEARYRMLVESTSDMVFHVALPSPMPLSLPPAQQMDRIFAEAAFTFVNDAQAHAFGFEDAAEMIGRKLVEVLPRTPENEATADAVIAAGHRIENARTEERDRRGRRKAMLNTIVGHVEDGRVHGWAGTARDITREVEAEEALRESEARHRLAIDAFQGAIYEYDPAADRTVRSGAFRELVGLAPEEIPPGKDGWLGLVHPDDIAAIPENFARLAAGEADRVEAEYRVRHRDGRWVHCWQRTLALRDASGRLLRTVGSIVDISARVAAERGLRESEERFRSFAENAPDVIYILDAVTRRLDYVSPAFERIWGEPRELILADRSRWLATLHPADRDRVVATMRAARGRGETCLAEYRILRASDAAVRHVRDTVVPLLDAEGRVVRVIGIVNDITDRKLAEGHRELLIRELNHRVKNTLATVQSIASQTLRTGCEEGVRKAFEERLISLAAAHDLLTRRNWEGIGLAEVAQEALRPHRAAGPDGAARIAIEGPDLDLKPKAALAFSMAFHELATNAAKHGALCVPSGCVALRWEVEGALLRLTWTERGGPPVRPPARRGFGSRLLERGLPHELSGALRLHYAEEGLRCEVEAPLGALVPQPSEP